jgi:DNA-binding NtrC family response regulator
VLHEAATHDRGRAADSPDVFIVEDETISRKALAMLLRSCGYKPVAYESAEEALKHLDSSARPLVMLVDLDLPGMSGMELIERLHRLHLAFRAILITAAEGEHVARFRQKHEVDYLRKPVNFQRLLQLLEDHSRGNRH